MNQQITSFLEEIILTLPKEEQAGFAAAKTSADLLAVTHQYGAKGVGRGMLLAAMNELEKELSKTEVTKLIYAAANGYAWRKTCRIYP